MVSNSMYGLYVKVFTWGLIGKIYKYLPRFAIRWQVVDKFLSQLVSKSLVIGKYLASMYWQD